MKLFTLGLASAGVLALLSSGAGCSSDSGGSGNSTGGLSSGGAGGKGGGTFAGTGGGSGSGGSGATGGFSGTGGKAGTGGAGGSAGAKACDPGPNLGKSCEQVVMAPDGGTNPCVDCLRSRCCTTINTCFADPVCVGLNQCLTDNCRGQANLNQCANQYCMHCLQAGTQASIDKFNEISTCAQAECRSQCFTTPGDAGSDA